jgi:hypothetical protein
VLAGTSDTVAHRRGGATIVLEFDAPLDRARDS